MICIENDFGFMCASIRINIWRGEKNPPGVIQVFCHKIAAILSEGFGKHLLSSKPSKLISSNLHIINTPHPTPPVCVCACVCAISCCTFLYLQYIYLYHTCVLKSEFGHVWLLTTLVYLLKLLYVNSCVVGSHMAQNLFYFVHCICLCIFLQLFVWRIVP